MVSARPMPWPLAASSVTTSSIQALIPVGIGNTASVSVPTIRPFTLASSTVLAPDWTIAESARASSGGALDESCGSSLPNASTTSSVTSSSTSMSTLTGAIYLPRRRRASGTGPPGYEGPERMGKDRRACLPGGYKGQMAEKALVLGGGGVTGIAWEIGILAGLAEHGVHLSDADLVIGTSAGSVVGVDVRSGVGLADLYQKQIAPATGEIYARMSLPVMLKFVRAMALTRKPEVARRRIGAMARKAQTETEAARRAVIESRIPVREWPSGKLQITAVDSESGEFAVFDAASGVDLVDAVGASCAVPGIWPPVTIDGRRYVDGGMRSGTNADLAAACERVVVLAPLAQGFGTVESLRKQVSRLTDLGVRVAVVTPDKAARKAFGRNVLDPAHRPAAARAGRAQAESAVGPVSAVWTADEPAHGTG